MTTELTLGAKVRTGERLPHLIGAGITLEVVCILEVAESIRKAPPV